MRWSEAVMIFITVVGALLLLALVSLVLCLAVRGRWCPAYLRDHLSFGRQAAAAPSGEVTQGSVGKWKDHIDWLQGQFYRNSPELPTIKCQSCAV